MTALPTEWFRPPPGGWTLADLQRVPEGARVEVLDGALIVNLRPLPLHQRMVRRLAAQLEPARPEGWQLETDVDVMLDDDPLDYVAPDLTVFDAALPLTARPIRPGDVLLVVEVVSRWSRREDRGAKPIAYADAGITWYWRLESPLSGAPAPKLHVHHLDASGAHVEVARFSGICEPTGPFPCRLDLGALA